MGQNLKAFIAGQGNILNGESALIALPMKLNGLSVRQLLIIYKVQIGQRRTSPINVQILSQVQLGVAEMLQ